MTKSRKVEPPPEDEDRSSAFARLVDPALDLIEYRWVKIIVLVLMLLFGADDFEHGKIIFSILRIFGVTSNE